MSAAAEKNSIGGGDGWSRSRLFLVFAAITVVALCESYTVLAGSQSIPYHVLFLLGGPGSKGDYVNVEVPGAYIGRKDEHVTLSKRIGCVAGDTLTFKNRAHFCNGEFLGRVLDRTHDGRWLKPFVWNGPVPAGKVFIVGTHERSWDSRYFGFVDAAKTERLKPLF